MFQQHLLSLNKSSALRQETLQCQSRGRWTIQYLGEFVLNLSDPFILSTCVQCNVMNLFHFADFPTLETLATLMQVFRASWTWRRSWTALLPRRAFGNTSRGRSYWGTAHTFQKTLMVWLLFLSFISLLISFKTKKKKKTPNIHLLYLE